MSSDRLDQITIRGFKSIASLEGLRLGPINVLIGSNGSGKSNFVGVFSFLHAIREGRLRQYVTAAGGAEKVLHFSSKNTEKIYFQLSFQNRLNEYALTLAPTADDGLFPSEELVYYWQKDLYSEPYIESLSPREQGREAGISSATLQKVPRWVRDRLGRWRVYHFHDTSASSPMRKTAAIHDNQVLRADGANLAAFLYLLREKQPSHYELILKTIRRAAPFLDDFQLEPLRRNPDDIKLEWRHKSSDQYFDASSLSDGTLRFIVLTTLFLQPVEYRPSVILVDEPELGLHPYAIGLLASLIRQASVDTQVIVSTQSPQLLDHFDPKEVLVADRINGRTEISHLDAEELAAWLEEYSLGQLWEKNELGGRPAPVTS